MCLLLLMLYSIGLGKCTKGLTTLRDMSSEDFERGAGGQKELYNHFIAEIYKHSGRHSIFPLGATCALGNLVRDVVSNLHRFEGILEKEWRKVRGEAKAMLAIRTHEHLL